MHLIRSRVPSALHAARGIALVAAAAVAWIACAAAEGNGSEAVARRAESPTEAAVRAGVERIDSAAAALDRIFQPLPLMSFAEEATLRRSSNAQHLARARALGIPRGLSAERLQALEQEGRLIRLENTDQWIVRDLNRSQALGVPAVRAVLTEIGERFHARLAALGAPPYRLEVTSVLRTAADQAALRRVNPNAAAGESTHEFGTTFDVLYSAYSAPAQPIVDISVPEAPAIEPFLRRHADVAAERVAGRRALELKAILGKVLIEMQREGKLLVTLERLQPVYHLTVARSP
jgi:hypothetical protein